MDYKKGVLINDGHNFVFWNFRETTRHFSLRSQNIEYPRIFQVTGANQNARKLLSTDLVNTKYWYTHSKFVFEELYSKNTWTFFIFILSLYMLLSLLLLLIISLLFIYFYLKFGQLFSLGQYLTWLKVDLTWDSVQVRQYKTFCINTVCFLFLVITLIHFLKVYWYDSLRFASYAWWLVAHRL